MDSGGKYVEEAVTNPVNVSIPAYRLTEGLNFLVKKNYETFIQTSE
jgi:hypothetical protein